MRVSRCDVCSSEVEWKTLSRPEDWALVIVNKRVWEPYKNGVDRYGETGRSSPEQFKYELCGPCLAKIEETLCPKM